MNDIQHERNHCVRLMLPPLLICLSLLLLSKTNSVLAPQSNRCTCALCMPDSTSSHRVGVHPAGGRGRSQHFPHVEPSYTKHFAGGDDGENSVFGITEPGQPRLRRLSNQGLQDILERRQYLHGRLHHFQESKEPSLYKLICIQDGDKVTIMQTSMLAATSRSKGAAPRSQTPLPLLLCNIMGRWSTW